MGVFNPSFLFGLVVLLYLSSFVVFALLRIATGISIQRIGYFSLRRIAYTPRDGVRIELRGLGLHLHRPTFAQPTWISLRLSELKVTINAKDLTAPTKRQTNGHDGDANHGGSATSSSSPKPILRHRKPDGSRSRAWKQLMRIKEKIKQLHEKIHWLKMADLEANNSSLVLTGVGRFEIGTLTMFVDTRRNTVDRGRLFQHKKVPARDQRPAEWMFTVKGILFTREGKDSLEIVDIATLNIHGLLYKDMAGLRDSSIALKLGRVHVPYDDLVACFDEVKRRRQTPHDARIEESDDISLSDVIDELDRPGTREERIVQTVSDSKEFVSSILRGIQEIQMAISAVGLTKEIKTLHQPGSSIYMNLSMNEFGIDMHRLDSKSPAHRMYFSAKDIAHQALLAAISISLTLDDGKGDLERLIYVPMATTTIKTTLPSKTVSFSEDKNAAERNANILFANLVVTSPSIDLDPKHLPVVLALLERQSQKSPAGVAGKASSHHLFSRLLPKANINFSIHEPVLRITLPPSDPKLKETDEFDMLICDIASMSLNADSSHSAVGDLHYGLNSSLRIASNQLYYQNAAGEKFDLLVTESLELKVQVTASPAVRVIATGNMQTLSIHLVRREITNGLRQIMQQIRHRDLNITKLSRPSHPKDPDFLRPWPPWLVEFSLQGSNFGIEVAGIDRAICGNTRGIAFQLDSWTAEYKIRRDAPTQRPPSRRTMTTKASDPPEPSIIVTPPSQDGAAAITTDGRRLAIHIRGLQGFVVEGTDVTESDSFVSMPRFEVAFSTSSDHEGPLFHINSHIKALYLHYSLYRYYAFGVASKVIQQAFALDKRSRSDPGDASGSEKDAGTTTIPSYGRRAELVSIDVKTELLQIKARMPTEPHLMIQVLGVEAGRHRWAKPFIRTQLFRTFVETPRMPHTWTRIFVSKNLRADLREVRKKRSNVVTEERLFDIAADFLSFNVAHQLVLYKVFDSLVNVAKASQQLHHRFTTESDEYILEKKPEGPKEVPRVSFRTKAFLFAIEDSPFEWKLATIYRVGLNEQKQRRAREHAFQAKVRHMEALKQRKASARRNQPPSAQSRSRSHVSHASKDEGEDSEERRRGRSASPQSRRSRNIRYDPEGKCWLSQEAKISVQEARRRLDRYNAECWKKRIDGVYKIQSRGMREIRSIFWGSEVKPDDSENKERIISLPDRPPLLCFLVSDLHLNIGKPSFPLHEYNKFLHSIGKGMPMDMQYSLLIPMNIQLNMGEARVHLRDYPLPLLHVPAIRPGQSPRLSSWSVKTDFVVAEEFRGPHSTRNVAVEVVPSEKMKDSCSAHGFAIDVRRTVSPVKTYSDVDMSINTSGSTKITWGTSFQPAIQDVMMVIESFSRPQVDPSDRVGFWDKIRLSAHSRVLVSWKGDGDVHFQLKGSRDPYVVTGNGAGFVMIWRDNVRWAIHQDDDPKKFMTVDAGEYALAIPDYSHQAREAVALVSDRDSISSAGSQTKSGTAVRKTIMKLSGNVRWLAGLVFEQDLPDGGRSFEFMPHYDIVLTTPEHAVPPPNKVYDAFRGFRSNHIHLSIAVEAPQDRDWTNTSETTPSTSYNSIHMTPRFFTHFFAWWSLFSGVMALPIRQGKLFPGIEKTSKKFGRHLATIKYNLLLAPLFLAHVYKHKDAEDYVQDRVSATGLKLRLESFMLDVHQRREESAALGRGRAKQMKTSAMKIHKAQLDLYSADLRAISANISGTTHDDLRNASDADLLNWQQNANSVDLSNVHIPDQDHSWVDADDFVELGWILPSATDPPTSILPLAFAPRFTYYRQTDHKGNLKQQQESRSSPFGNEPTHHCKMSQDTDPRKVQRRLISERIERLDEHIKAHKRLVDEQELLVVRDSNRDPSVKERFETLKDQAAQLEGKRGFLAALVEKHDESLAENMPWELIAGRTAPKFTYTDRDGYDPIHVDDWKTPSAETSIIDFNNRFIIHNPQLKWNNSLRNVILRYGHQVSQRRGFVYYLSRRAVKFILDIVEEQSKHKHPKTPSPDSATPGSESQASSAAEEAAKEASIEDRIQELLSDGKKFVDANDPEKSDDQPGWSTETEAKDIANEYAPLNTYFARLIAPQIQFQSEKNSKSILLVTAKAMQLKVVQIMDKDRMTDDVSGLVQRRYSVDVDSMQCFVTTHKIFYDFTHLHNTVHYGSAKDSMWPPWVPFEVNFDFEFDPFGWSRVVQKTSASLRYEKYNTLRLKYNDEVNSGDAKHQHGPETEESKIDHLWVDFPHLRAICDSTQYYTMYVIVLDLLLYNEPLEKVRSEKLEKIMLASDFSDLRGAPEMVVNLQSRIRQLEEIKTHFQIHSKYLDRQGWLDHLAIEEDLASCEDELFFMMKAITTSQRKIDDRTQTSQTNGLVRWYISASEIVWHLMRERNDPLVEVQLSNAVYERTDNSDGSNRNSMEIDRMQALNLVSDAIYPELLGAYTESGKKFLDGEIPKMLKIKWYSLEAIAGIPVLDNFEIDLYPLKVQLTYDVGHKLFEYIFPGAYKKGAGENGFAPRQAIANGSDKESDTETIPSTSHTPRVEVNPASPLENGSSSPKFFESRVRATTSYPENHTSTPNKFKAWSNQAKTESHRFNLFSHSNASNTSQKGLKQSGHHTASRKPSAESLAISRHSRDESSANISSTNSTAVSSSKRGGFLKRTQTTSHGKEENHDDLSQMLKRASDYMTYAYVKIPSVILCLSYKGKDERNITDVHNFVFRMPVLEYRNKTWSNIDLVNQLKKDVVRALVSHTGAIIGNKIAHHRPGKSKQHRLRELANNSTLLPSRSQIHSNHNGGSEIGSLRDISGESSPRVSQDAASSASLWGNSQTTSPGLPRTNSFASSLRNQAVINGGGARAKEGGRPVSAHYHDSEERENPLRIMQHNLTRRFTGDLHIHRPRRTNTSATMIANSNGESESRSLNTPPPTVPSRSTATEQEEDNEEKDRKKSVLLLGKKILGTLN